MLEANYSLKEVFVDRRDLVADALNLLKKDFAQIGVDFSVDASTYADYPSFLNNLRSLVTSLLEKHTPLFFQLMYRVDLGEKKVKELMDTIEEIPLTALSEGILNRELQKAVFRNKFRSKT